MKVVSNTSPLIALAKVGQLLGLSKLFPHLWIPPAVSQEFLANCTSLERHVFLAALSEFIEVVPVKSLLSVRRQLGLGELEALSLARQSSADLLLLDDRKASNEAREQQLVIASTRAVLKIAEERGVIGSAQELEKLMRQQQVFLPNY